MTGIVDWSTRHARMVLAMVALSLAAGVLAYTGLPKEGAPDIEVPALFISVPFPGISAEDSEQLLVRPLESRLKDLDGLESINSTAAEGYAGVFLEFEFGWDKSNTIAEVRDKLNKAQTDFPEGADQATISEINFSEFPIIVVTLSGELPERTLVRVARTLKEKLEALPPVLEAGLTGYRQEMLEVTIDPLKLESYDTSLNEVISVVSRNNKLIAAGQVEGSSGAFSIKIPSSFDEPRDVYELPILVNGDRFVTLGELADIRMTFVDAAGTARYDGEKTIAIQVVMRKGFNIIDTSQLIRDETKSVVDSWPDELSAAINTGFAVDRSRNVESMVDQLESSVITAISIVMIVVLAVLGTRSALLVGFAIPTSFLLCFALLALLEVPISNIVMFGLILAVGMLVDSAIVIVELGDRKIRDGTGPMAAYAQAAKRMFWPIISSTATTLCAFLPMLFWPGVAGEFMGMLPVTLIFVLSASLVVALIFLPVLGGVSGRFTRTMDSVSRSLRRRAFFLRATVVAATGTALFGSALAVLNPPAPLKEFGLAGSIPGSILFVIAAVAFSIGIESVKLERKAKRIGPKSGRSYFGRFIGIIVENPIMPLVTVVAVAGIVGMTFIYFSKNNHGVEFFTAAEPEQAKIFVRARGNLSVEEQDQFVRSVEKLVNGTEGIGATFAFAGEGGLANNGGSKPNDSIGEIQIEFDLWEDRQAIGGRVTNANNIVEDLQASIKEVAGIIPEVEILQNGPAQGKPLHLRLSGSNWNELLAATEYVRSKFENTNGLVLIEDSRPLPGIDWQIEIDVEKAGLFGANVEQVGAVIQMLTHGILIDTMRVEDADDEIEIRLRLPKEDRLLSTFDRLTVQTSSGLVPLSNFAEIRPVKQLAEIARREESRYIDVKAGVDTNQFNVNERNGHLTNWLENEAELPDSVNWKWTGTQEEQNETQQFLMQAFIGALGLMFAILLAQFNSFYASFLVLGVVVFSVAGALIGMIVMKQPFSIIMTGTGIVALAGIVVNNNIVLIDTYQEYSAIMPRLEAIVKTVELRLRPVFLTTITTMAGLTPMMFGISIDLFGGGYTVGAPASLWWIQLATAVVFGLGIATIMTLVFTPSMLALRIWAYKGAYSSSNLLSVLVKGKNSRTARDRRLKKAIREAKASELIWEQEIRKISEIEKPVEDEFVEDASRRHAKDIFKPIDLAAWQNKLAGDKSSSSRQDGTDGEPREEYPVKPKIPYSAAE
ncbi:MAG: efflux RND transporter permease subunit [Albidovulum sp.]|nr:efflux RND transporter permease subunit [Albidovulum sp.]